LADSDTALLQASSDELRREGYEVLTAEDGFAALHVLRGAQPDVLVAELNLPRMSGFELLSVVRTRFPAISVLAVSDEYTVVTLPPEAICDAFLEKTSHTASEVVEQVRELVSKSPVRGSRAKLDFAPVWLPRSTVGYLILTCPECLRSFSAAEPNLSPAEETCIFCGARVQFQMSSAGKVPPPDSPLVTSRWVREQARDVVARSRKVRNRSHGNDVTEKHELGPEAIEAIKVEIQTGQTFARVALNSKDRKKTLRNRAHAQKAYDTARRWAEQRLLPQAESKEIADQLELLKAELGKLEKSKKQ
jgi:DNA-binding response OmpR family regulator